MSEKAMACTRKSSAPHLAATIAKAASTVAGSSMSQWPTTIPPTSCASGSTRFFNVALIGESKLGALRRQAFAIPRRSNGCWQPPGSGRVCHARDSRLRACSSSLRRRRPGHLWHRAKAHKEPPFARARTARWWNIGAAHVFVPVIWFSCEACRARYRDVRPMVRTADSAVVGKGNAHWADPAGHRGCSSGAADATRGRSPATSSWPTIWSRTRWCGRCGRSICSMAAIAQLALYDPDQSQPQSPVRWRRPPCRRSVTTTPQWRGQGRRARHRSARSPRSPRINGRRPAGRARRPHLPRGRRSAGRADRDGNVATRASACPDQGLSRRRAPDAPPRQMSSRRSTMIDRDSPVTEDELHPMSTASPGRSPRRRRRLAHLPSGGCRPRRPRGAQADAIVRYGTVALESHLGALRSRRAGPRRTPWRAVAAAAAMAFLAGGVVGWMAHAASAAAPSRFDISPPGARCPQVQAEGAIRSRSPAPSACIWCSGCRSASITSCGYLTWSRVD